MRELCRDILRNIFHLFPAKDLIPLKLVCRSWKRIIEDPLFVKSHTKIRQSAAAASILIQNSCGGDLLSIPTDRLHFAADVHDINVCTIPLKLKQLELVPRAPVNLPAPSCNGLILLSHRRNIDASWVIWNPLTQDSHEIPPPFADPQMITPNYCLLSYGFGYDEASDDYKVVRVDMVSYRNNLVNSRKERCMIYSMKLRFWREMKTSFPREIYKGVGVFLNGALHWRSWRRDEIFVLHLGREDHHLMAGPPPQAYYRDRMWGSLDAVDGCLITSNIDERAKVMDVWVMKDYENSRLWTKLVSIAITHLNARVVGYLKSKGQVFIKHGKSGLKWVDLETKCEKEITISGVGVGDRLSFGQLLPGSIVRLDTTKKEKGQRSEEEDEE